MNITQRPFLKRDFHKYSYAVVDISATSPNYFDITHCPDTIGGGRSLIKLKGNGQFLVRKSQVEVEVLDVSGNAVKTEITTFIDRFNNYFATVYVYDNTAQGIGRVNVVGAASSDLNGVALDDKSHNELGYNVIWSKAINILPFERNNSELVIDQAPMVTVDQVIAPLRINSLQVTTEQFTAVTSSQTTIVTSNFRGFDKKDSNSTSTTDLRLQNIRINPNKDSTTTNAVDTTTRKRNADIDGGYQINEINTYNTILQTSTPFFSSSYVGGFVQFYNNNYTLSPQTQSNSTVSSINPYDKTTTSAAQSVATQLASWKSNIVKIVDTYTAYLDQSVQINVDTTTNQGTATTTHTYKQASNFTASVVYTPNSEAYITSSNVSQSYLQFTFTDLKPLAGDIYKIRAFYKRNSVNQDWTLLNDQIIKAPEYLTDASYPNQTSYARTVSDYLLLGYFTSQRVGDVNWNVYNDLPTGFDTATASYASTPLIDSICLQSAPSYNRILTTKYYQNYVENRTFTLGFNCILQPYTKLDLYMSSDALATTLLDTTYQQRAFNKSKNLEKGRYGNDYNRFGKYIGKIENNTANTVNYGKVAFDFITDNDGLGRPLLRCSATATAYTGSIYLSEISIKPQKLNGFTPEIVQFAIPTPSDYSSFLSESVDYKLEYFDYTGNQSEYVTYINSIPLNLTTTIPTNGCQAEANYSAFLATQGSASYYPGLFQPYYFAACNSTKSFIERITSSGVPTYPNANVRKFYADFQDPGVSNAAVALLQYLPFFGWNTLKPSMSISRGQTGTYTGSFNFSPDWTAGTYNPSQGTITSSWHYVDPFIAAYLNNSATPSVYSSSLYTQAFTQSAASIVDSQSFWNSGGVGISYLNVSNSYYSYSVASLDSEKTEALKKRRLFWPTLPNSSGSYFTENGGIYNVRFRLKKHTGGAQPGSSYSVPGNKEFYPQTGSYLRVFIFDINKTFTAASKGTAGWYPPDNNIVRIGHGYVLGSVTTPTLTWYDSATGYYYEDYDVNLIQYGTPGQLVFEPSGDNNNYFGTIISDVQFCKIGVTSDPAFIKPTGVANFYSITPQGQSSLPQR